MFGHPGRHFSRRCLWVQSPDPHKVFERLALFSLKLHVFIYLWPFFWGVENSWLLLRSFRPLILRHGVFLETNLQQKTNAEDSAISSQEILLEVVDIRHIQQQPSIGLLCCKSFGCFLGSLGFQTPNPVVSNENKSGCSGFFLEIILPSFIGINHCKDPY